MHMTDQLPRNPLHTALAAAFGTSTGQFRVGATLARLAAEAGVPAADTMRVLAGDDYADDVRNDVRDLQALGGGGVPFYVVDRRYGISGAQPVEVFLRTLEAARADALAAAK